MNSSMYSVGEPESYIDNLSLYKLVTATKINANKVKRIPPSRESFLRHSRQAYVIRIAAVASSENKIELQRQLMSELAGSTNPMPAAKAPIIQAPGKKPGSQAVILN